MPTPRQTGPSPTPPEESRPADTLDLGSVQDAEGDSPDGWADAVVEPAPTAPDDAASDGTQGWVDLVAPEVADDEDADDSGTIGDDPDAAHGAYDRLMAEDETD
ncbi:hypothetical protein [Roseospira visakhapatnamensis]|uniref:Uncharacterized protein n=1 Tax=Roseospira visakhapatnamensis TaxID=390880 RepID=A0A7W6WAU9_9PROT|nr:hypothetical protein [Roseospira visakhapatnamensis]MBB4267575.1 hypothetical protein [Roseospira visakhapatnamensis]